MIYEGDVKDLIVKENFKDKIFSNSSLVYVGHIKPDISKGEKFCKRFVFKCGTCEKDSEIFSDGLFISYLSYYKISMVCGCTGRVQYKEEQWRVLAERKAAEMNLIFVGWYGAFESSGTKVQLSCLKHGHLKNKPSLFMVSQNNCYCQECYKENFGILKPNSRQVKVEEFFKTGAYHPDTQFSLLGNLRGTGVYWEVSCPVCNLSTQVISGSLKKGRVSCGCNRLKNQKQAYIFIIEDNEIPIAIKFGIATDYKNRLYCINQKSSLNIKAHKVFIFPDRFATADAEKECKISLETQILSRVELPMGFTETTYTYNIEAIETIYKKFLGVEKLLD